MKKSIVLFLLFLPILSLLGQDLEEKYGYQPYTHSLTQGKYSEVFDEDHIVRIGSVAFNPETGEIEGFLDENDELEIKEDLSGRWVTMDPLSEKYVGWSPYNYVAGNPIIYVDPDGREIKPSREVNENGKPVVTIAVTGKLVNNSSTPYTKDQMQQIADRVAHSIAESYSGSGKTIDWQAAASISVVSKDNPLTESDHAFRLYDNGKLPDSQNPGGTRPSGVIGHAPKGERVVELNKMIVKDIPLSDGRTATLERTAPHELGHSGSLDHITPKNSLPGNLMHQTSNPISGNKLTENQVLQIEKEYNSGNLNKGRQEIK